MTGWKIDDITAERRKKAEDRFRTAHRDELLDHIAKVEAALYTMALPLSDLDIEAGPRRSAYVSSKLFPAKIEGVPDGKYTVWNSDKKELEATAIPDDHLHEFEYAEAESISIMDGSKLNDDFPVISVHQNAIASYIYCGSIHMRDIRRAAALLWPKEMIDAAD